MFNINYYEFSQLYFVNQLSGEAAEITNGDGLLALVPLTPRGFITV